MIFLPLIPPPLLDTFTTYGTQLLCPLYTLRLLIGMLFLWFSKNKQPWLTVNRFALLFSCAYLVCGQVAQHTIRKRAKQDQLANSGQLLVMPTPVNTIYWRVLSYQGDSDHEAFTYVGDKKNTTMAQLHE